jgi:hypothetical protein
MAIPSRLYSAPHKKQELISMREKKILTLWAMGGYINTLMRRIFIFKKLKWN